MLTWLFVDLSRLALWLSLGLSLVGLLHGDALRYPSETPISPTTSGGRSRLRELTGTFCDAPASGSFWHRTLASARACSQSRTSPPRRTFPAQKNTG